jgi:hypothetical protein
MRFKSFAAACAIATMALTAPAFAEETPPAPTAEAQPAAQQPAETTAAQTPAEDPNEVICKRLEAETGTRLGKRKECRTRREWDQIAEEAKQNLEKSQTKN